MNSFFYTNAEFLFKILNDSSSFFNLIVDVSETSSCTYILAFFLVDQVNLLSTIHDTMTYFKSKVSITNFSTVSLLTKYVYLDFFKWLKVSP